MLSADADFLRSSLMLSRHCRAGLSHTAATTYTRVSYVSQKQREMGHPTST